MPKLIGGRKPVKARIKRGKIIGSGVEGEVREIEAIITSKGRSKAVPLVEKVFFEKGSYNSFRNPEKQFEVMRGLQELNRKYGLGLHIPVTIRLRRQKLKKPAIISSRFELIKEGGRTTEYLEDMSREIRIMKEYGYFVGPDAFSPARDKKTGKVVAAIVDFGTVWKITDNC